MTMTFQGHRNLNLCSYSIVKWHEVVWTFTVVSYVRDMTAKKCKYSEYRLFERLLFFRFFFWLFICLFIYICTLVAAIWVRNMNAVLFLWKLSWRKIILEGRPDGHKYSAMKFLLFFSLFSWLLAVLHRKWNSWFIPLSFELVWLCYWRWTVCEIHPKLMCCLYCLCAGGCTLTWPHLRVRMWRKCVGQSSEWFLFPCPLLKLLCV